MLLRFFVSFVLVSLGGIGTVLAQGSPPPETTVESTIIKPQHVEHVAVDSSFGGDSLGNRFASVSANFSPFSGIYESGIRLRATGDASWYRFLISEDPRISAKGRTLEGGLLAGYGVSLPRFSITGLVGPVFAESLSSGATTDEWGVRGVIETDAQPTDWTMASASVSYSSSSNSLFVKAKTGVKIFGDLYIGPEANFYWHEVFAPQTTVDSMHLGAHVSALKIGPAVFSVSGGWANDRKLGSGYYGSASIYIPF